MVQKRKPNIAKKSSPAETKKVETIITPKAEAVKSPIKQKQVLPKDKGFLFGTRNYLIMLLGLLFIVVGLIVMAGGGSTDPKVFNPDIFDTQRLTVAPILILIGFVVEVFAIMLKPKQKTEA